MTSRIRGRALLRSRGLYVRPFTFVAASATKSLKLLKPRNGSEEIRLQDQLGIEELDSVVGVAVGIGKGLAVGSRGRANARFHRGGTIQRYAGRPYPFDEETARSRQNSVNHELARAQIPVLVALPLFALVSAGLAILAHVIFRKFVPPERLLEQYDVAGYLVAVVGVLYSVVLGFLVGTVWTAFATAQQTTDLEAGYCLRRLRFRNAVGAAGTPRDRTDAGALRAPSARFGAPRRHRRGNGAALAGPARSSDHIDGANAAAGSRRQRRAAREQHAALGAHRRPAQRRRYATPALRAVAEPAARGNARGARARCADGDCFCVLLRRARLVRTDGDARGSLPARWALLRINPRTQHAVHERDQVSRDAWTLVITTNDL